MARKSRRQLTKESYRKIQRSKQERYLAPVSVQLGVN